MYFYTNDLVFYVIKELNTFKKMCQFILFTDWQKALLRSESSVLKNLAGLCPSSWKVAPKALEFPDWYENLWQFKLDSLDSLSSGDAPAGGLAMPEKPTIS